MGGRSNGEWASLIGEFENIRHDMLRLEEESTDLLREVHPEHRASARNLLHYLALRGRDLRGLQTRLSAAGLSSLGRSESHVLASVDAVLFVLRRLRGGGTAGDELADECVTLAEGERLLQAHTESVLGSRPARGVAIMVTMPSEAADDFTLISDLVRQGMDCMRINCAHDAPDRWQRMIEHLRRATEQQGRSCRVLMDLAGPKIRTGPIEPGPPVVKIKPERDRRGHVVQAARVWLFPQDEPRPSPTPAAASLPVPAEWLAQLSPGDQLRFEDAREATRTLQVLAVDSEGCWAEATQTCYVETGTPIRIERGDGSAPLESFEARVGELPPTEVPLRLTCGDMLTITRPPRLGRGAIHDEQGHLLTPASIACTAEQIFDDVRNGDSIWLDDGRIGGVVERSEPDRLHVRITRTRARGAKLGSEKGINLPNTRLRLPAITDKDRDDLAFVARHADMVALSFVNRVDDVRELRSLLEPFGAAPPGIVLKIETRRGFDNLPSMLLEAMKAPRCAVMIARGDLAVECGFERLAEVQEEILWLCEAAHVPVIWATQVLETLAKEGMPSRAEVTDAAMAHRAECVMLNKGPYVVQAVRVLDDILRRMHGHQAKKQSMLRQLALVANFRRTRPGRSTAQRV